MSTPPDNKQDPGAAAPRKETFLARYPRKLKIGVLGLLLVVLAVPWFFLGGNGPKEGKDRATASLPAAVSGADMEIADQAPAQATAPAAPSAPGKKEEGSAPSQSTSPSPAPEETASGDSNGNVFLPPAPEPSVTEDTPDGSLPRIGEDGRQPWQVYARPFNAGDKRPRIAIVITDLGLSRAASDAAINRLPPAVTLAFDAQSRVAGAWCARARQAGHETILQLPMEPFDYPRSDPGPNTLLTNLPNSDNIQRLQWALMQGSGYVGVTTLSGSRFTTDPSKITPILEVLHKRGLMIFDARVAPHSAITDLARTAHIPVAVETQRLDRNLAPAEIDDTLAQLEQTARLTGRAVAMSPPLPLVIDRLAAWSGQLSRDGIALAPLSAVAQ